LQGPDGHTGDEVLKSITRTSPAVSVEPIALGIIDKAAITLKLMLRIFRIA
jgi:hypothetical protein